MKDIDREEKVLNRIKQMGFDNIDEDKFKNVISTAFNPRNSKLTVISAVEAGVDITDAKEAFFIIYDQSGNYDFDQIKESFENIEKNNQEMDKDIFGSVGKIHLIGIFNSKSVEYNVSKGDGSLSENNLGELKKTIKEKIVKIDSRNIKYLSYFLPSKLNKKQILKIEIEDRIRSLEKQYLLPSNQNTEKAGTMKSYVFSAKLDSVIDLYDVFGDDLFDKNVRIGGIDDAKDVDNDIQNTYIESPDEFWFLNNGISLLIASTKPIDMSIFDRIEIGLDSIEDISVINGAQTIKAVSEVRYSVDNKRKSTACVLLRIYLYEKKQDEESEMIKFNNFSEKVTVALNKQKPIKQEDLAYMTNFVKNIQIIKNKIHKSDNYEDFKELTFSFVRRGEVESAILCQYHLEGIAKIVKTYLLKKPGEARSQAYGDLLETVKPRRDGELKLVKSEIFKEKLQENWDEQDKDEQIKEFLKYYSPVNFAMQLKEFLESKSGKEKSDKIKNFQQIMNDYIKEKREKQGDDYNKSKEKLDSFVKYGVLVMISAVINLLNDFGNEFSGWKYSLVIGVNEEGVDRTAEEDIDKNVINKKKLKEKMYMVFDGVVKYENNNKNDSDNINDSNFWKKDIIIDFIIEELKKQKDSNSK